MQFRAPLLVVVALAVPSLAIRAAEAEIVAVIASDPYADLKKQIRWVGTLIDQPMLDVLAETPIMGLTQFKGLAGLDVARPLGLVVTAAGDLPVVHAYVPVKDLGKLLDALVGVLGPVEVADGVRRVSPPGGMPLEIVERDGWAIIGPPGSTAPLDDPTAAFDAIAKPFTIGVEAFPHRMPEGMREQLRTLLERAAAAAAAQGRQVDPAGLTGILENLQQTQSLLLGVAIDVADERVYVESRNQMLPGTPAAAAFAAAAQTVGTVASPTTADGKPPAVSLHVAAAVPENLRRGAIDGLATIEAQDGSDVGTQTAVSILKAALAAMIEAGGYDAALAIDTSAVDGEPRSRVPAITAGMRVKDGAALEARIKKLVGDAGAVPGLAVAFDTGAVAGANLHTITLESADLPGGEPGAEPVRITLAVAPNYAFVLAGGDVAARLAAVADGSGKPAPSAVPVADVTVAVGPVLRYAAALASRDHDGGVEAAGLEAAAAVADAQASALVQLLLRPIERGLSLRLSADAGAIRTVAASVKSPAGGPRRGAPALAPDSRAPDSRAPDSRAPGPLAPALAP